MTRKRLTRKQLHSLLLALRRLLDRHGIDGSINHVLLLEVENGFQHVARVNGGDYGAIAVMCELAAYSYRQREEAAPPRKLDDEVPF